MFNQLRLKRGNSALLLFLIGSCPYLNAQVLIKCGASDEYAFNTRQTVNFVIVNSNPKAFSVFIQGKIKDGGGQTVEEFKSSELFLNVGSTIVKPMNTSLNDLYYYNQDIAEIETGTGTCPSRNHFQCVKCVEGLNQM